MVTPHPVGHLLLGQPAALAHRGQPVADHLGQEFLPARLNGFLATGAPDVLLADALLLLAGYERPPAGPVGLGPADLDLGAVEAYLDAFGGGVSEHVGQGV